MTSQYFDGGGTGSSTYNWTGAFNSTKPDSRWKPTGVSYTTAGGLEIGDTVILADWPDDSPEGVVMRIYEARSTAPIRASSNATARKYEIVAHVEWFGGRGSNFNAIDMASEQWTDVQPRYLLVINDFDPDSNG